MFHHRLSHRVGRSSQATPAAVEKSFPRLKHRNQDTPERRDTGEVLEATARYPLSSS
jgi:hypothetical protein